MRHPEQQYLDLMDAILTNGDRRIDRTGVGTLSIFGAMARFDLRNGHVPILTTARGYWKVGSRGMLWFLTGDTRLRPLLEQNVKICTDWPLAAYRKATGDQISQAAFESRVLSDDVFSEKWGQLGPVYGKQWRRWAGPDGREHDQIATLIETLRTNPSSRRMLFHAWNVAELDQMALPPCHMVYQFHVANGRLSCSLLQRSVDLMLGAPWFSGVAGGAYGSVH